MARYCRCGMVRQWATKNREIAAPSIGTEARFVCKEDSQRERVGATVQSCRSLYRRMSMYSRLHRSLNQLRKAWPPMARQEPMHIWLNSRLIHALGRNLETWTPCICMEAMLSPSIAPSIMRWCPEKTPGLWRGLIRPGVVEQGEKSPFTGLDLKLEL